MKMLVLAMVLVMVLVMVLLLQKGSVKDKYK
jgi:preprotein translocase subunit SecG